MERGSLEKPNEKRLEIHFIENQGTESTGS